MSYSILPILHSRTLDDKLHKVQLRVIFDRKKYYAKTKFRVRKTQLESGVITNHPKSKAINAALDIQRVDIETRLIELIKHNKLSPAEIKAAVTGQEESFKLIDVLAKVVDNYRGRVSNNTIHNYTVSVKKIDEYKPDVELNECTPTLLGSFEQWMRLEKIFDKESKGLVQKYHNNTVCKYLQMVKSVLNKAAILGLVDKKVFEDYKRPKSTQSVPVWLTLEELDKLSKAVSGTSDSYIQQAGYYFLLSCYTGYRISDAKLFDYEKYLNGDRITLRATKNKRIVSIPVYDKLSPVLEYCRDHKFTLSEQKARLHVKSLCKIAGIKKDVKFHSARHTFGMMLMARGFTIDEAAELLGDTPLVAKVYARIHSPSLDKKILEKL